MAVATDGLRPSGAIRHAEIDGCRVILDLNTESYLVFDDVASGMWRVITGEADRDRSLAALADRYDVERERLEADLAEFARTCVHKGFLTDREEAAATGSFTSRRPRGSGVRAALASMLATRRALDRDGFRTTYERYAALPAGRDAGRLPRALAAFERAENLFVAGRAPNDCLVRSLSLYRFLCTADVPAQHVIGVHRFPLQVHAWAEAGGEPVLDVRARGFGFTPLARIG